ncbi:hypothetical protein V6Z11_A03G114100 [Gossypium hirsutum]
MYFEGASPSTTRSRKPISSPKIITSRQAFASAVIGSPVLPSGATKLVSGIKRRRRHRSQYRLKLWYS